MKLTHISLNSICGRELPHAAGVFVLNAHQFGYDWSANAVVSVLLFKQIADK